MKTTVRKTGIAPRSTLAIAGKTRPPKVEKLKGDELPPPEAAEERRPPEKKSA